MPTPTELPAHVGQLLGVTEAIERDALIAKVDAVQEQLAQFGLSAEEIADALIQGPLPEGVISTEKQPRSLVDWRSIELLRDGAHDCLAIIVPKSGVTVSLATATGQLLVRAWMIDRQVITHCLTPGILMAYVPKACSSPTFVKKLLANWSLTCQVDHSVTPAWVGQSQIVVGADSLILRTVAPSYNDLFVEMLYEPKVKWRFLSMYRVLEHGYLSSVFEGIKSTFLQNPKQSLTDALEALESELNQLTNLVESEDLTTHFEEFHDAFDAQKRGLNKYACAIDRSVEKSGWLKRSPKKWQKGVMLFYKLRCSIVHAGMGTPVYEGFDDAADCLNGLLVKCESVSLGFLHITVR